MSDLGGRWVTISGRKVFIKDGQDLASAMKDSGKFGDINKKVEAIEEYFSGERMWINDYLRGNEDIALNEEEQEYLNNLRNATDEKLEYKEDLYRSVNADAIFGEISDIEFENLNELLVYGEENKYTLEIKDKFLKNIEGREITEKGFLSTTKDYEIAEQFGDFTGSERPIVMEIETSENTKGIDIMKNASAKMKDVESQDPQKEVLLKDNQSYTVKNVETKDGTIIVKVKMK